MRIWVTMKDNPNMQKNIDEKEFNEKTMVKVPPKTEEDIKKSKLIWDDMLKSRKGPASFMSTKGQSPSLTHNGKLDSGSVENLLDVGLESAKKRAISRNKKKGSSFKKNKRLIRRKK